MRRCTLACIAIIGLATLPGCSADPAYESIFQDYKAAVERATTAMKNVRDVKSLKESNELILKEADTIHELTKKLGELGKPNSASKKVAKKYLDELEAMSADIDRASKQFSKVLTTASLSKEDRLKYAMAPTIFAAELERFGVVASIMDK
jgi:hypothetical protein